MGIRKPVSEQGIRALEASLSDNEAAVRTAVAWALAVNGHPELALEVLLEDLTHTNDWVRLRAAIVLDEMDEQARTALPALERAMEDGNRYVVRVVNRAINDLMGTTNVVP